MRVVGTYAISSEYFTPLLHVSFDYFKLANMHIRQKVYLSRLKSKVISNQIGSLLNFNISIVSEKPNLRLRKFHLKISEGKQKFNLKSHILSIKSILNIFNKFENSNFFF